MTIRCLIIDDEFLARQLLEGYIQKVPFLELVGQCESAFEAMQILQDEKIDLMFLDVNMPELSGINFIRTLKHKPEIIITTAYSEHALEGYQLDVMEYLLKPIYFERFMQAINKVRDMICMKAKAREVERKDDIAEVSRISKGEDYLFIKTGTQMIVKVYLNDILYIESLHEYVRIWLRDESHTIYHSLKSLLEFLPGNQFIQIHRSSIVNFHKVEAIEGNCVKINGQSISIGKNYRDEFLNRVKSKSIGIQPGKPSPRGNDEPGDIPAAE
ncbi:MAG TPA: LytTR family DNA-binding domain-containing protein [Ohtaekwangia sp.]|uniref:LytR/AlgR family response regulator transcription factor n=1 Tax=Ohtaekwangia sp. TaxID=2066019 RepID=UPI002F944A9B